jgi:hypothetical protein
MFLLCCIGALAAIPLQSIRTNSTYRRVLSQRRVDSFLWRFLVVNACWGLAIRCFNPFTTVYLTRQMGVTLPNLGTFVSATQFLQALALLASSWILRRLPLVSTIAATQLTAGLALLVLSATHNWAQASLPLVGYLLTQNIVNPNMQTLLMNNVFPASRSSASAMYLLTVSIAQSVAGAVSGIAITRFDILLFSLPQLSLPSSQQFHCAAFFESALLRCPLLSPSSSSRTVDGIEAKVQLAWPD